VSRPDWSIIMSILPFFAFVLSLVIPSALIILIAALLWIRRT
jgi:hypothetical protein